MKLICIIFIGFKLPTFKHRTQIHILKLRFTYNKIKIEILRRERNCIIISSKMPNISVSILTLCIEIVCDSLYLKR